MDDGVGTGAATGAAMVAPLTRHAAYDGPGCPVEAALEVTGGKWKGIVLYHLLAEGPLRHSDLRRRCRTATPRVLTRQLREMEADGLLWRRVHASVPPRVEYGLTAAGESLRPVVGALRSWGLARIGPAAGG